MRAQLPSMEEIEALLAGRKQTAVVFFLDETFEELEYDATTTVLEAVGFLAGVIKLQAYQTFTLYECRKARARNCHSALFCCACVRAACAMLMNDYCPMHPLTMHRAWHWHMDSPQACCNMPVWQGKNSPILPGKRFSSTVDMPSSMPGNGYGVKETTRGVQYVGVTVATACPPQLARGAEVGAPAADEHYILDDNRYVADVLAECRAARGRDYQSRVLFKKRMFRETDETITEPQFVTLSYVQVLFSGLLGFETC